jgi:hypothetical protein
VIDAQIAAHGVDENELALAPGAVLDALLPLGGGKLGKLGVDLVGRGLGRYGRWECDRGSSHENKKRQWFHVADPLRLFSQQWHKP